LVALVFWAAVDRAALVAVVTEALAAVEQIRRPKY
jgi:hypothetical protein